MFAGNLTAKRIIKIAKEYVDYGETEMLEKCDGCPKICYMNFTDFYDVECSICDKCAIKLICNECLIPKYNQNIYFIEDNDSCSPNDEGEYYFTKCDELDNCSCKKIIEENGILCTLCKECQVEIYDNNLCNVKIIEVEHTDNMTKMQNNKL